jgi:putative intracellular protease/amidase
MSIPLFVSERSKPQVTTRPLSVGCLIFERMDQVDFTGPFEVLSRVPDTTIQIIAKEVASVRDVQGLRLTPDLSLAEAGVFDVLLVPGGYGQQALMHDEGVLTLIRKHVQMEKLLFSVCTGALLCGAAGVLTGRQVTTHWSVRDLMRYYGAVLVDARAVVDGNLISAAQLIDLQIEVFGQPSPLTPFELEDCCRRAEKINSLRRELDQLGITAIQLDDWRKV